MLTGKKVVCCGTDKDNSGLNKSMRSSGVRMGGLLQRWTRGREKTYKIYYLNKRINSEATKKKPKKIQYQVEKMFTLILPMQM